MDEDDTKLDIEAAANKTEELKRVEELSFSQDRFEDLEGQYAVLLEDLMGPNLQKFRDEYERQYQILKSSYEREKQAVKKCRNQIDEIFRNAQEVRAANRMLN